VAIERYQGATGSIRAPVRRPFMMGQAGGRTAAATGGSRPALRLADPSTRNSLRGDAWRDKRSLPNLAAKSQLSRTMTRSELRGSWCVSDRQGQVRSLPRRRGIQGPGNQRPVSICPGSRLRRGQERYGNSLTRCRAATLAAPGLASRAPGAGAAGVLLGGQDHPIFIVGHRWSAADSASMPRTREAISRALDSRQPPVLVKKPCRGLGRGAENRKQAWASTDFAPKGAGTGDRVSRCRRTRFLGKLITAGQGQFKTRPSFHYLGARRRARANGLVHGTFQQFEG